MEAHNLLRQARAAGFRLGVVDGNLLVTPASKLTDGLRRALQGRKCELMVLLKTSHADTVELLTAAMKVCDQYGDSEEARQEMRRQCLELPPHLQVDLRQHFAQRRLVSESTAP